MTHIEIELIRWYNGYLPEEVSFGSEIEGYFYNNCKIKTYDADRITAEAQ